MLPNGTKLVTQAADKSKGSSNSIFSGKQTWLFMKLSTPYAERIGLCKRISLSGLDRRLQRKTIIKQVYVLPPPSTSSKTYPFCSLPTLSSLANSLSAGNFSGVLQGVDEALCDSFYPSIYRTKHFISLYSEDKQGVLRSQAG